MMALWKWKSTVVIMIYEMARIQKIMYFEIFNHASNGYKISNFNAVIPCLCLIHRLEASKSIEFSCVYVSKILDKINNLDLQIL